MQALRFTKPNKAPGPDGYQPLFFQKYCHILGKSMHDLVAKAFVSSDVHPKLNSTLIVLIPKNDWPITIKEFRPISLCILIYKIITKVLY